MLPKKYLNADHCTVWNLSSDIPRPVIALHNSGLHSTNGHPTNTNITLFPAPLITALTLADRNLQTL
jgi:hypothetical protein